VNCGGDLTPCGNTCVDTNTSFGNCGGCALSCSQGQVCQSGKCQCSGNLKQCGNVCTDTDTDRSNCGSCGHACVLRTSCINGKCLGILGDGN
jgi:hypothetical protein